MLSSIKLDSNGVSGIGHTHQRIPPSRRIPPVQMAQPAPGLAVADVAELYRAFSRQLQRIVGGSVSAPHPMVEDACQFAWCRLLHHRVRVQRDKAPAWLVATALHEALKLVARAD